MSPIDFKCVQLLDCASVVNVVFQLVCDRIAIRNRA